MRFDLRAGGLAAAILVASGSAPLLAQSLTLGEVLASSRQHTPQVLEAIARVRAAEGRRLATDGAFDIVFKGDADSRLAGFYDGKSLGASVTRPLQTMGGELYAGYRVSDGRFPVYEDERFTNQLGELKAGVVFALLRDRLIDDRRFARNVADVDIELARNEQLMIAIGVQRRAMDAYGTWVAIGLRLEVLRALLALAEGRQDGLRGQVARGMKPTILLVENDQNILRRKALVVEAEQALSIAATRLSLYLRDETGLPVTPPPGRLPLCPAGPRPSRRTTPGRWPPRGRTSRRSTCGCSRRASGWH